MKTQTTLCARQSASPAPPVYLRDISFRELCARTDIPDSIKAQVSTHIFGDGWVTPATRRAVHVLARAGIGNVTLWEQER